MKIVKILFVVVLLSAVAVFGGLQVLPATRTKPNRPQQPKSVIRPTVIPLPVGRRSIARNALRQSAPRCARRRTATRQSAPRCVRRRTATRQSAPRCARRKAATRPSAPKSARRKTATRQSAPKSVLITPARKNPVTQRAVPRHASRIAPALTATETSSHQPG